jgi:carboxypeptidase Q
MDITRCYSSKLDLRLSQLWVYAILERLYTGGIFSLQKTIPALPAAIFLSLAILLAPVASRPQQGPNEDGTAPALVKIAGEGFIESRAFEYLTELSDDIGPRVTGSPAGQRAIDWGAAKMRAIGLENVHAEKFQMWRGWTRGIAQAELLTPIQRPLHIDAMGWTGSTAAGGVEADVVPANNYDLDRELKDMKRFKDKIILMVSEGSPRNTGDMIFVRFADFVRAAAKAGALGIIGGQGGFGSEGLNLTHTGILGFSADFTLPVVSMTAEDQGQLERDVLGGKSVRMRLNVQNTFTNGPVETANVVGEIRGREHPEEVFVVGAHLDSWDLSEGSTDNGMGASSVLSAAEAILRAGIRPRRTLRFVLFTGEEQGLLGSYAYVQQHQSEMSNHLGDLILDEGQGPVKELQLGGRRDLVAAFRPFLRQIADIRPVDVNDKIEFGSDTGPFIAAGLPGINMQQDSPDYKFTHHSAADALEAVKPEVLTQDAVLMALTAYWIADRPDRLAKPWPPEKTARVLREQNQYDFLKASGLWTFGDKGQHPSSDSPEN